LFNEREIWWCFVGENVGVEISGKGKMFRRPVLVLKKLDKSSFIGIPFTGTKRIGNWYCQILFNNKPNTVILSQIRHFDYRRMANILGTIPKDDFELIKLYFFRSTI
jgi:hypothetical protein